jgi:hypothetical protein
MVLIVCASLVLMVVGLGAFAMSQSAIHEIEGIVASALGLLLFAVALIIYYIGSVGRRLDARLEQLAKSIENLKH